AMLLLVPLIVLSTPFLHSILLFFCSTSPAPTQIYTLSLHDALPILEVEDERELIVFDYNDCKFYELNYYEKVKYVDHWNGNKLERLLLEGTQEIEVTNDYVSLDEHDGNNFYTINKNEHQTIQKVIGTDDIYLIKKWNDYEGTITTCDLWYYDDLYIYLESIDRDVNEYLSLIDKL